MSEWISINDRLPKRMEPVKLKWNGDANGKGGGEAYGRLKRIRDLEFQAMTKNGYFRNSYVNTPDFWQPLPKEVTP